jgi:hypothetical protein
VIPVDDFMPFPIVGKVLILPVAEFMRGDVRGVHAPSLPSEIVVQYSLFPISRILASRVGFRERASIPATPDKFVSLSAAIATFVFLISIAG